jgi:hypothetical protein
LPGLDGAQLKKVRTKKINTTKGTLEEETARDETPPAGREEEDLRSVHKIFVIGQWSFVIGHLDEK